MNWHSIIYKNSIYLKASFRNIAYRFYPEPNPEKWVFVVGCYNSGTTLLSNILGKHPEVGTMPLEGRRFTNELPNAYEHGIPRLWALKPELFYLDDTMGENINVSKIKREWAYMYNNRDKRVLLEKSPVNSGRTRWFQKNFSNCHFIIIFRNGYSVAEGIRRKAGHSLDKAIQQWVNSNEILLNDMPFLKNKLIITYENLTKNPGNIFNAITDFLGLEPLPGNILNMEFKIHERNNKIANFNDSSLKNLNDADIKLINKNAEATLQKLGYEIIQTAI